MLRLTSKTLQNQHFRSSPMSNSLLQKATLFNFVCLLLRIRKLYNWHRRNV